MSGLRVQGFNGLQSYRISKWRDKDGDNPNQALPDIAEELSHGKGLARGEWATLNRARSKVAKTGDNLVRWGVKPTSACICGEDPQTLMHIMSECPLSPHCTEDDLKLASEDACHWIREWCGKI